MEVRWSSFGVTRTTGSYCGGISSIQMHIYSDKGGGSGLPAPCALTRACGRSIGWSWGRAHSWKGPAATHRCSYYILYMLFTRCVMRTPRS